MNVVRHLRCPPCLGSLALAGCLLLAASPRPARAAEEVQVPLDRAGHIEVLDRGLARRLDLFLDRHPLLQEVRLFQAGDSSFVLEITQLVGGRRTRSREPLSAAEVDSLRARVSGRAAERSPQIARDQSGRPLLLGGCAALGVGFYAWAVPALMGVETGRAASGAYFLTAATSILAPMILTQQTEVPFATADLALYGGTRGIAHGALLYEALARFDDSDNRLGAAVAGSLVEGAALGLWARAARLGEGEAGAINTGGDLGLLYGLGIADLTGRLDGEHDGAIAALTLAGSGLGMAGGRWLARHRDYTYGDAGVMRAAGVVGGGLGAALARAGGAERSEPVTAAAMAGGALGLAIGDVLVRDTDLTAGQMVIVDLVTAAGAFFGLGVGLIGGSSWDEDWDRVALPAVALGAAAGYAVGLTGVRERARADGGAGAAGSRHGLHRAPAWRLGLEPHAAPAGTRGGAWPAAPALFLTLCRRLD